MSLNRVRSVFEQRIDLEVRGELETIRWPYQVLFDPVLWPLAPSGEDRGKSLSSTDSVIDADHGDPSIEIAAQAEMIRSMLQEFARPL